MSNKAESFDSAVLKIGVEAAQLVSRKQRDYGPKNILNCPVGAELGILVRLYDKLARAANLMEKGAETNFESLDDTVQDIIGYGMVWKMVREDTFTLPLETTPKYGACDCMTCSGFCGCGKAGHHNK